METSFISTLIILSFSTFILYRVGAIKLAQTSSDKLISQADKGLAVWAVTNDEKRSRVYGKVVSKIKDKSISRSSESEARRLLAGLEAKQATA